MNHSNLTVIVDSRSKHPYGLPRRLQFFAHNAGKTLADIEKRKHTRIFAITNK